MNVGGFLKALSEILTDPAANLTAAALLAAAVTLIILILCVVLLLYLLPGSKERKRPQRPEEVGAEEPEAAPAVERRRRPLSPRARVWLVAGLVVASAVSGYAVTSTDRYCADACHHSSSIVESRGKTVHARVACISCHEDPLPLGLVGNVGTRLGHVVRRATTGMSGPVERGAGVPSARCLRCHADVTGKTVLDRTTKVRTSHKAPVEAGMACSDCHDRAGHGPKGLRVSMSRCIGCHDGTRTSSKCSTCHAGDTGFAAAVGSERIFTRVQLGPPKDCGGCHDQARCDACHGLRMPHSDQFKQIGHARFAGFQKKETCWRCHTQVDCGRCHASFVRAHSGIARWFPEHKLYPFNSKCDTCHIRHGATSMCALCHDVPK